MRPFLSKISSFMVTETGTTITSSINRSPTRQQERMQPCLLPVGCREVAISTTAPQSWTWIGTSKSLRISNISSRRKQEILRLNTILLRSQSEELSNLNILIGFIERLTGNKTWRIFIRIRFFNGNKNRELFRKPG